MKQVTAVVVAGDGVHDLRQPLNDLVNRDLTQLASAKIGGEFTETTLHVGDRPWTPAIA